MCEVIHSTTTISAPALVVPSPPAAIPQGPITHPEAVLHINPPVCPATTTTTTLGKGLGLHFSVHVFAQFRAFFPSSPAPPRPPKSQHADPRLQQRADFLPITLDPYMWAHRLDANAANDGHDGTALKKGCTAHRRKNLVQGAYTTTCLPSPTRLHPEPSRATRGTPSTPFSWGGGTRVKLASSLDLARSFRAVLVRHIVASAVPRHHRVPALGPSALFPRTLHAAHHIWIAFTQVTVVISRRHRVTTLPSTAASFSQCHLDGSSGSQTTPRHSDIPLMSLLCLVVACIEFAGFGDEI
ncbi:hypothetical protein C8F04DRAFT_1357035 [Mycena alexandri]|uniref:Uncharacterized protein n=1 Tax=Mycena alexandri TaxID=1745969 RepID=A0AAD6SSB3_9AGAR|nr:hypothetical protein C8F04DRAFT_1357035 [Mycena alexandri]